VAQTIFQIRPLGRSGLVSLERPRRNATKDSVNVWNTYELQHKSLKGLGLGFGTATSLAIAEHRSLFPPLDASRLSLCLCLSPPLLSILYHS
jgi:hypothetical protein